LAIALEDPLHDLGDGLAGGFGDDFATANEWRTAPLIDLDPRGGRRRYLHDGRAGSIAEAILWHGGEAQARPSLGVHGDVPDRQGDEPVTRLGLEDRPIDDRWSVGIMGVEQHAAEGPLMRLAAENDRLSFAGFPHPGSTIGGPDGTRV
jgi:hypothetical protein